MVLSLFSMKLFLALYAVYGTSPPRVPTYATMCPKPCFSTEVAFGSNRVTKSPLPPMKAPYIAGKATDFSMLKSFLG